MKTKTMIIAEAGVNHNGSIALAKKLVEVAAEAGADAVKFQTFDTDQVLTKNTPKAEYQVTGDDDADTQYEMIKKLELSRDEFVELGEHCKKNKILFLSTPFDHGSLDFLTRTMQVPQIKIASNEITNAPLLLSAALTNKPIILSTGMSNLSDIEEALSVIALGYLGSDIDKTDVNFREAYNSAVGQELLREKVTVLHCTSSYPAKYEDVNLSAMSTLSAAFGLRVGYSDHTPGISIPIVAVGLGAQVIEKHFTLSKDLNGPDHQTSLSPDELGVMIKEIRNVEVAMGDGVKRPMKSEYEMLRVMRRSLVANNSINKGEKFTPETLTIKQPGHGLSPMKYWDYLKKNAEKDYEKDGIIY